MSEWIQSLPMRAVCVGRFVIEIPEDSPVSYGPARLAGWNITTIDDETDERFNLRLQEREQELRTAKNMRGGVSFEAAKRISTGEIGAVIFVFGRQWNYGLRGGERKDYERVEIQAMVRSGQTSYNLYSQLNEPNEAEELAHLIKNFRHRNNNSVPSEPGFCFDGGLVRDPLTASQSESTVMFIGLKGHPDVAMALHTLAGYVPAESLIQRDAKSSVGQRYASRFHSLRKGQRALNGILGEEVLERVSEPNGATVHGLMWQSHSKKDDVYLPAMTLELDTGKGRPGRPVQSSLSDAAVLALWDKISSSLRVRKVIEPVAQAPYPLPHEKHVYAYHPCPATGWWSCSDGDNQFPVQGGARQYFQRGVSMPQASLMGPPTTWEKIKGERPTFSRGMPTLWVWNNIEAAAAAAFPEIEPRQES